MAVNYKLCRWTDGTVNPGIIQRFPDTAFIPKVDSNIDYQEYLQWLAQGNEPEPADEPQQSENP